MRRRAAVLRGASILALLALSACSPPPIDIAATQIGGHTMLALSQDWGIVLSQKKAPCVRTVEIFAGASAEGDAIWKIQLSGQRQCVDVASVVIGEAPPGFDTIVSLDAKRKGPVYVVVVGIGGGSAPLNL